jgi:alanine racemase
MPVLDPVLSSSSIGGLPETASVVIDVDLDALAYNYRFIESYIGPQRLCVPVVKANAYGLGMGPVAQHLSHVGASHFFVATVEEGLSLRKSLPFAQIYLLNGIWSECALEVAQARLIPVLSSLHQIRLWQEAARFLEISLPAIFQAETGLTRLGLSLENLKTLADTPTLYEGILPKALMTHLACAYLPGHPYNQEQKKRFDEALVFFPHLKASLAGSGGLFQGKEYLYDWVRPGRLLYGSTFTAEESFSDKVRSVVTLRVRILQIQEVAQGQSIGYDQTFVSQRPMRVATLGIGYADGYFRSLSNQAWAIMGGVQVPIVGRVSMDLMTVDVTDVPESILQQEGWVTLLNKELTVDWLGELAGTVSWEVLTRLGQRPSYRYLSSENLFS